MCVRRPTLRREDLVVFDEKVAFACECGVPAGVLHEAARLWGMCVAEKRLTGLITMCKVLGTTKSCSHFPYSPVSRCFLSKHGFVSVYPGTLPVFPCLSNVSGVHSIRFRSGTTLFWLLLRRHAMISPHNMSSYRANAHLIL